MRRLVSAELLAILVLGVIAAFLRLYRLDEIPVGLWRDEAANGLEAFNVLSGARPIFFGTREPMFIYLVAPSVAILGKDPVAIRVVAALAGTATIPITYLLVKELFRSTDQRSGALASLTSFWLATSYWHLNFSRLGFRGVLLPLFTSLAFYFLWRGWNRLNACLDAGAGERRLVHLCFAAAGLCLGLAMYTYTPVRFLPLALLSFAAPLVAGRWRGRLPIYSLRNTDPRSVSPLTATALFGLSFLLVFAPLGIYFVSDPGSFFARSGVSVFHATHDEPIAVVLLRNALRQLGMFGFLADPNTRHDPAGRPAFDPLTLFFFTVGAVVCLRRWRGLPYMFSLVWFVAMLLPAIVTFPELPHYLRAIGALPVAYVFPAIGVERTWQWLRARRTSDRVRHAFTAVTALGLVLTGLLTYRDYFFPAVDKAQLTMAFDLRFVEAASLMNELGATDAVWLIPLGPHDEQRMPYWIIDFLYGGEAPHRYIRVDETSVVQQLSEACRGKKRAMLLNTTREYPTQPWFDLYVDSGALVPSTLDSNAEHLQTVLADGFMVTVYKLPEDTGPWSARGVEAP